MKEILFHLDPELPASLQVQLREQLVDGILNRALQPGERLPSSRGLAKHLGVSRNTVTLVYQSLADDGFLASNPRSGFVVAEDAPAHPTLMQDEVEGEDAPPTEGKMDWRKRFAKPQNQLHQVLKPLNWREYPYPFVYGQADFSQFGHSEWRDCARQALGARDFGSLAGDFGINDDPLLVDYIAGHSLPHRGINGSRDQVLVTMGAQNSIFLAMALLATDKTTIGLEDPGYPDVRNIARNKASRIIPLKIDQQGLVPDEELLRQCDIVFTTPSHQSPTNVTMPIHRRKILLELAEKHDFLILEDDYEYEMNFLASPTPALKSLDRSGRVIYVGSFSKSLFPGLRLGYLAADPAFVREARRLRHLMYRHPPGHSQRTAAYFMALGHYSAQMRKLNRVFSKRREVLANALERYGLVNNQAASFGGTSFWVTGPASLDSVVLAEHLLQKGVLIEPGTPFFQERKGNCHHFRIAYSAIATDKLERGTQLIAEAIDQLAPMKGPSGATV